MLIAGCLIGCCMVNDSRKQYKPQQRKLPLPVGVGSSAVVGTKKNQAPLSVLITGLGCGLGLGHTFKTFFSRHQS